MKSFMNQNKEVKLKTAKTITDIEINKDANKKISE